MIERDMCLSKMSGQLVGGRLGLERLGPKLSKARWQQKAGLSADPGDGQWCPCQQTNLTRLFCQTNTF